MDPNTLVTEETDAGAELVNQFDKSMPVKVSFWLKPADGGQWYLYIASDQITDGNLDQGYREVLRLAKHHPSPYLDPFRVKLIPATDPLAEAALEIHRRFPGVLATRLGGRNFGGSSVEGAYIYPSLVSAHLCSALGSKMKPLCVGYAADWAAPFDRG